MRVLTNHYGFANAARENQHGVGPSLVRAAIISGHQPGASFARPVIQARQGP